MPSPSVGADHQRSGPTVSAHGVQFRFRHAPGITGVRLELDFSVEPTNCEFRLTGDEWSLHLPRPAVDRLEYQFTVRTGGDLWWTPDPGNPATVANPFGQKSEILFPGYQPPRWLGTPEIGTLQRIPTRIGRLDGAVPTSLWSPPGLGADTGAPLLLAHDGSDMAARGSLLQWAAMAARDRPFRLGLLDPVAGRRDQWYAADPDYADHLAAVTVPALRGLVAVTRTVGLGASLGALSMLFVQRRHPGLLQGLVLQSGSYFSRTLDPQESGFDRFDAICAAVTELLAGPAADPGPVFLTCGLVEENRANNEAMAIALQSQGYAVRLQLVADAHTMIGWRDAWSPALEGVLDAVGG